ncbi:lytic transglycosylase domain-containing protein [soil metagenome]
MVRRVWVRVAFTALLAGSVLSPVGPFGATAPAIAVPQVNGSAVQAAETAFKGDFVRAGVLAERSGDQAAVKLVELLYLRSNWKSAGYTRIMNFIKAAPRWPLAETLLKRAEQTLYNNQATAQMVFNHFAERSPLTPEGMLALARAKLATGDAAGARKLVSKVWTTQVLDAGLERQVANEFGPLLSSSDHRERLWNLIYLQETNAAARAAKFLSRDYQTAAKVAQALIRGAGSADKQFASLSAVMRQQPALEYALARAYRKANRDSKAFAILSSVSGHNEANDGEAWWIERRIVARQLLAHDSRDSWKSAYQLARGHGFTKGEYAVEGEFLAGWIALRFLKDGDLAVKHFTHLQAVAVTRTEKARAAYWLGRAYAAVGNSGDAKASYRLAAQTPTIFYGQLAREQLGLGDEPFKIPSGQPSAAARAEIDNDEVMRAFAIVAKTGRERELNSFLWAISGRFKSVDEMNAAADVAARAGGPATAVRLAKLAGQKGYDIDSWGYPTKALPDWKSIGKPVERPLVYGLSRQESEFDPNAGSGAGARGLMQLMPGTAQLIARQYKLSYAANKLTGDPSYNVKLGAAHLGDLIDDFGGSYILTLAAYNACPRRAREWVQAYGDPRGGTIDPIDWIELIPFTETRNYVQKVMQNVHVYRARMAPGTMRGMMADLRRGAPKSLALANTAEPGTSKCSAKGGDITDLISSCD